VVLVGEVHTRSFLLAAAAAATPLLPRHRRTRHLSHGALDDFVDLLYPLAVREGVIAVAVNNLAVIQRMHHNGVNAQNQDEEGQLGL